MSTNSSDCSGLSASADVLGIGIRVNFYTTMLFLALIPRTPNTEELLNKLYTNTGIAGFGLLLTAIIQTGLKQLLFFEALFTLHILFFLGTGVAPVGKHHWMTSRVVMGILVQFVSVITFTVWGLYVWANVKTFGKDAACNDSIKYVVLFFTVRATAPWLRGIWITALVLSAVGLIMSFGWRAVEIFEEKRLAERLKAEKAEVTGTPETPPHAEAQTEEKGWYFDISFTLLLSAIYSTIMLELMVHRNVKSGVITFDNSWAFGQVLAVVMILANSNEVLQCFFEFLDRRRERREEQAQTALRHEGQLETVPTLHGSGGPSAPNVSARDQPTDKIPTRNLDKSNAEMSETIIV